jgi:hypothetical protein
MKYLVELFGGRFDGEMLEVPQACIDTGFIVHADCALHGEGVWCMCDKCMVHGYRDSPDAETRFEVKGVLK